MHKNAKGLIKNKTIHFSFLAQNGMKNLKYLMEHVLLQLFKIIFSITSKNMKHLLIILQYKFTLTKWMIKLLLKSNQDITLLELLLTETMNLLESKEIKDRNR